MALDDFRSHMISWAPKFVSLGQYQVARGIGSRYLAQEDAGKRGLLVAAGKATKISLALAVQAFPEMRTMISPTETYPLPSIGEISLAKVKLTPQKYGFKSVEALEYALATGQYPKMNIAGRHYLPENCVRLQDETHHYWRFRGELDCFLLMTALWRLIAEGRIAEVLPDENQALQAPAYLSAALVYLEELRSARARSAVFADAAATKELIADYGRHYENLRWVLAKAKVWQHESITGLLPQGHVLSLHEQALVPDFTGGEK